MKNNRFLFAFYSFEILKWDIGVREGIRKVIYVKIGEVWTQVYKLCASWSHAHFLPLTQNRDPKFLKLDLLLSLVSDVTAVNMKLYSSKRNKGITNV